MRRKFILVEALLLTACTNRFVIVEETGASLDARMEAASLDSASLDAGLPDSKADVALDAQSDTREVSLDACAANQCMCTPVRVACTTTCSEGICLDRGCGMRCALPGADCASLDDCPSNSMCITTSSGRYCSSNMNLGTQRYCTDSRHCPAGFACGGAMCTPHIVFCDVTHRCPGGFVCEVTPEGRSVCGKLYRSCVSDSVCPSGTTCRDIDADTTNECVPSVGSCERNNQCAETRRVCGTDANGAAACQTTGPCTSSFDCDEGFECRDYWGDGFRECVRARTSPGGCQTTRACGPAEVCAPDSTGLLGCTGAILVP